MDHDKINRAMQGIYQSRLSNKVSECQVYFTPDAELRIAGMEPDRPMSLQEKLAELVELWHFDQIDDLDIIIDQAKAVSRYQLTVTFNPTGEQTQLEISDWVTFNDNYLVTEFVQHLDTAELLRISTPKPEP